MKSSQARLVLMVVSCLPAWVPSPARAYITAPVQTLGQLCISTYVTVVRVEKVSKEKGVIVYRKVRDLKGKYPLDVIRHAFDLKNTPQHKGLGDVPIRPDEKDWTYALSWAEVGKTAVVFSLKYDPYGDFGHTYIDRCWYATMCPQRDWDWWYSIYSDAALLSRWHCGTPTQLATAIEQVLAGKTAVVPTLAEGTREDLRQGRAKLRGLKVSLALQDFNPARDGVAGWMSKEVSALIKELDHQDRELRLQALRELALAGVDGKPALARLLPLVQDKDEGISLAALQALSLIEPDPTQVLPVFQNALGSASPAVRLGAVRALGRMGSRAREAAPALSKLLHAKDIERLDVAEALGRIDPGNPDLKAAAAEMIELLREPDSAKRLRVIELLGRVGVESAEVGIAVAALFGDPDREVRLRTGAALAQMGSSARPAVAALIAALKDADRDVRIQVAETLGLIGPGAASAVAVLGEVVRKDPSGTVRMRAADALGKLGPDAKAARPALEMALKDPAMAQRPEVLAKIREILGQLK